MVRKKTFAGINERGWAQTNSRRRVLIPTAEIQERKERIETDDKIKEYVDNTVQDLYRKLSTVGRGLSEHNRRIDRLSGYICEEIDKHISKINGRLAGKWRYKIDNCVREEVKKQVTRINGDLEVLLESGIKSTVDDLNENVSYLQKEVDRLIDQVKDRQTLISGDSESNNFPESSQELTNSNYSLEDVLTIPTAKPKIKKRRGKENKITLIYDSPNPAKVELRPKDIGSLELTIYSRGMDADEIREKTLVFDPYNPETNSKNLEIFLDETEAHYADNTLDSLIVSLNNPELNEYFGKHMSTHFGKIYDLMTNTLNSEFKGENKDLTSKLKRVQVERNKRRAGYNAFNSGRRLFGAISPIVRTAQVIPRGEIRLFPMKLFTYLGRIIE